MIIAIPCCPVVDVQEGMYLGGVKRATAIVKLNPQGVIMLTSKAARDKGELHEMTKFLKANGIQDITEFGSAIDTWGNLQALSEVPQTELPINILSNFYHLPRIALFWSKISETPINLIAAEDIVGYDEIPQTEYINRLESELRGITQIINGNYKFKSNGISN